MNSLDFVTCTNAPELFYVLKCAESEGKNVAPYMWRVDVFPYHLSLHGKIVGWTDKSDRAVNYISFIDFVEGDR